MCEEDTAKRIVNLDSFEVPFSMETADELTYRRRFLTLFMEVGQKTHRGGSGVVYKVENAAGEVFALKRLIREEHHPLVDEERYERLRDAQERAFRKEYENQQRLSRFKGFPRLYGYGMIEDDPIILMEWIEGITLTQARDEMVAYPKTYQWSPPDIALLGMSLFSLLSRMNCLEECFIHRDISPNNIMFRTNRQNVAEQFESGELDLCLIDFGSSSMAEAQGTSFTVDANMLRKATPDYAPPEMLTNDLPDLAERRASPSIDVYAASSVLYELFDGHTPYRLAGQGQVASFYRFKTDHAISAPVGVHTVPSMEPSGFEKPLEQYCSKLAVGIDEGGEQRLLESVQVVDAQLGFIIMKGLGKTREERASAVDMYAMLSTFHDNYYDNISRRYHGAHIVPFTREVSRSALQRASVEVKAPELASFTVIRPNDQPAMPENAPRGAAPQYEMPPYGATPALGMTPTPGMTPQYGEVLQPARTTMREDGQGPRHLPTAAKAAVLLCALVVCGIFASALTSTIAQPAFTFPLFGAERTGVLSPMVATTVSLLLVLVSFFVSGVGSTPAAKLLAGSMGLAIPSVALVILVWLAQWDTVYVPACIGLVLVVDMAVTCAAEFALYRLAQSRA